MSTTVEPIRSPKQVLEDHLRLRSACRLEDDLSRNYAEDVIVFGSEGRFDGHDGIRRTAEILGTHVNEGNYAYLEQHTDGEIAYLTWTATEDGYEIHGSDTFLIRDGQILVQTIHVVRMASSSSDDPDIAA